MRVRCGVAKASIPGAQADAEVFADRDMRALLVFVQQHFSGDVAGVRVHVFFLVLVDQAFR
jgi:hypothetical protein